MAGKVVIIVNKGMIEEVITDHKMEVSIIDYDNIREGGDPIEDIQPRVSRKAMKDAEKIAEDMAEDYLEEEE